VLILEVLAIEDVGLFLGNVVYVLLPFWYKYVFYGKFGMFPPFWYVAPRKIWQPWTRQPFIVKYVWILRTMSASNLHYNYNRLEKESLDSGK
jgi:hypothetical protein